jgi:hypothetical protein
MFRGGYGLGHPEGDGSPEADGIFVGDIIANHGHGVSQVLSPLIPERGTGQ